MRLSESVSSPLMHRRQCQRRRLSEMGLDARISPETAAKVDAETRQIVEEAVNQAWKLLESYRPALDELAARLCEQETVAGDEVTAVLNQAAFRHNGKHEWTETVPER